MGNGVMAIKNNPFYSFDTLSFSKRLIQVGVPDKQAEVFAELHKEYFDSIKETLSTKEELNNKLKELELNLKHDIKISALRLKNDLTMRLGLMITAGIGIFATLIKIL
ncbi:MAG: hypothetical protein JRJ44_02790 [Deltaproteobacteria bacterium]|nr:hypothetical protein [Deltaproteobacteria bacterium]